MIVADPALLFSRGSPSSSSSLDPARIADDGAPDILKPPSAPRSARHRSMSIDFTQSGPHSAMFGQPDMDAPFGALQGGDIQPGHASPHMHVGAHHMDRTDPLDLPDHNGYDIFSSTASGSLASQRYRANASSSSSLGPSYSLGVDPMYQQSSFSDNLQSFHSSNSNPYDLIGSLSSSYSSGKPSPITPSDVNGLPHSGFPFSNGQSKDYSHPGYHDSMLDRRLSNVSGSGYSSEFNDDFGSIGVNSNLGLNGFSSSGLPPFPDRLGRVQSESRFNSTVPPLGTTAHLGQNHSPDLIRGVAPQATHAFQPDTRLPSFDDMQFMTPSPAVDYPLRLPASVDENMARLRLQGAGDLQTFIRYALT
jgi:recombining binding protein suppressor of hairless